MKNWSIRADDALGVLFKYFMEQLNISEVRLKTITHYLEDIKLISKVESEGEGIYVIDFLIVNRYIEVRQGF